MLKKVCAKEQVRVCIVHCDRFFNPLTVVQISVKLGFDMLAFKINSEEF